MAEYELLVLYRDITPSDFGDSDPKADWTFSILAAHFYAAIFSITPI